MFELAASLRSERGWARVFARNEWFQRYVMRQLADVVQYGDRENMVLFSYSYTAREPFRLAKERGWRTVLGQIDPGPVEEEVVAQDSARCSSMAAGETRPAARYWAAWREEVRLADVLIVNSEWSRTLLRKGGVPDEKIRIVPLAFESDGWTEVAHGDVPVRFASDRPLRVLFLGQVVLRKGIGQLFDAIELLADAPVEFRVVGSVGVNIPDRVRNRDNVCFLPPVPRHLTEEHYKWADVFVLPTLSDGFAITQLEAQSHGLPVIASKRCGEVVRQGENGLLLEDVTPEAIAGSLRRCFQEPGLVRRFAQNSRVDDRFALEALQGALNSLFD